MCSLTGMHVRSRGVVPSSQVSQSGWWSISNSSLLNDVRLVSSVSCAKTTSDARPPTSRCRSPRSRHRYEKAWETQRQERKVGSLQRCYAATLNKEGLCSVLLLQDMTRSFVIQLLEVARIWNGELVPWQQEHTEAV
jgi:hypothetical protein